ncbi:MAG: glycosyltransferase, partial [Vicinamibacterales bacterium]
MTATPTRVLYLSHAFAVGGAEEMVLNLVRHLPPQYVPAVACIHEAGPIGLEIERTGVPFKVLGLKPGVLRPFDVLRLRDFLYECQPDIVHTFLLTGSLYGRFAAMMARVPVVIGTEVNVYERKRPLHALAERWLMRGT